MTQSVLTNQHRKGGRPAKTTTIPTFDRTTYRPQRDYKSTAHDPLPIWYPTATWRSRVRTAVRSSRKRLTREAMMEKLNHLRRLPAHRRAPHLDYTGPDLSVHWVHFLTVLKCPREMTTKDVMAVTGLSERLARRVMVLLPEVMASLHRMVIAPLKPLEIDEQNIPF